MHDFAVFGRAPVHNSPCILTCIYWTCYLGLLHVNPEI